MDLNILDPFLNQAAINDVQGEFYAVVTAAGIGSIWQPTAAEKAAIAADRPVLLFFPGRTDHPGVFLQALEDPDTEPSMDIPPETGLQRVKLIGGPLDDQYRAASYGRAHIFNAAPGSFPIEPIDPETFEVYTHIPGDPEDEYRHAITYLIATTPGVDDEAKWDNMIAERDEVDEWRKAHYRSLALGILPPEVGALATPVERVSCHFALVHFDVPNPPIPGP